MIEIFVVRHAVTDWNTERRFQGHSDIPINGAGRSELAKYRLPSSWESALLLASPLIRARETAQILSGREPEIEPALMEMNWGLWEGKKYTDLKAELGEIFTKNEDRGLDFRPEQGESPRDVCDRLQLWFEALVNQKQKRIVAVTHKGIIRAMMALAFDWDMMGKAPVKLQRYAGHHFSISQDGQLRNIAMNLVLKENLSD
jgi:broad specificity phosphatase PhoE